MKIRLTVWLKDGRVLRGSYPSTEIPGRLAAIQKSGQAVDLTTEHYDA